MLLLEAREKARKVWETPINEAAALMTEARLQDEEALILLENESRVII